jgi:hypothetical protein
MAITNTATHEPHREWLFGGNPRAIKDQERRGQDELVRCSQLPTNGLAEVASKLGIKVLRQSAGDDLFSDVELPDGWKIQVAGKHVMWSELVDAAGVVRANIFYKASFYDRRAEIALAGEESGA